MPKVTQQVAPKKAPAKAPAKPKAAGVIGRIQPMELVEAWLRVCLYGQSGSGKTTFWGSFPGKILAVISSGGDQPGELLSLNTPEHKAKIDTVNIQASGECHEVAAYLQANPGTYSTLVLDHASSLQDLVLREILNLTQLPAQLSWGLATQQQYGQVALQMKEILRGFLNVPAHSVIVAQEREFNTDNDESLLMPYVSAALSPSVAGWLAPACDYVVQTYKRPKTKEVVVKVAGKEVKKTVAAGGVEFCLRTAPNAVYTTKFRLPKGTELPDHLVNPTFEDFYALVHSGN